MMIIISIGHVISLSEEFLPHIESEGHSTMSALNVSDANTFARKKKSELLISYGRILFNNPYHNLS